VAVPVLNEYRYILETDKQTTKETMATIDFAVSGKLKGFSVPAFKFNLDYGDLSAKGKFLEVDRAIVTINENALFLVGYFPNISQFVFGKWNNSAQKPGSQYKGMYEADPLLTPKPTDLILLAIEKNEKFTGYNSFLGLWHYLKDKSGGDGKIVGSRLTLDSSVYSWIEAKGGTPQSLEDIEPFMELASRQGRVSLNFYGILPESGQSKYDFSEIEKVVIDSNAGSSSGGGGRGGTVVTMETWSDKVKHKLQFLSSEEDRDKIVSAYIAWKTIVIDDPEVLTGNFDFIDFLRIVMD
jgi:hypothetical protein